ncbi:hypothetical protein JCM16303_000708 [Sporobolomyces ruberrimus]
MPQPKVESRATPVASSSLPLLSTTTAPESRSLPDLAADTKQSSSGSNSVEESPREDSGGAGMESDDEREPSGSGSGSGIQTTREDSDEQVTNLTRLHHHEMYPFPSTSHHQFQRHSSAEVEASSAGSVSSDFSEDDEDNDEEDVEMKEAKPVTIPKRTLSEYRASLSRAGLAAPPRIRRIGALGISVHSESDIENPQVSGLDTNDRIDPASGGDTSAGTRETDLGVSFAHLQDGTGSGSRSTESRAPKRRKRGVADATFRGIVDELAVENRQLKDKLRRYEAHGVPVELKDSRLFEVRFYAGLPTDQRTELESFLTRYVQDFVDHSPSPSQPSTRRRRGPPVEFPFRDPRQPSTWPVQCHTSLPSPQESDPSERPVINPGRALADSSNSGVEPFSLSGVGAGVYRTSGQPSPSMYSSISYPSQVPIPAILSNHDRDIAKSVIASLEQLFRRSLRQNKEEPSGNDEDQRSKSNETYMANFLSHDFLSDGWVYLNLASTMAELHRYAVTLNFVQEAVRDHSTNLEVSEDGKRVRWCGPSPAPSPPPPEVPAASEESTSVFKAPRRAVKIASPAPTDSQVSSGGITSTDDSRSSSNPSSSGFNSNQIANSIAPTASTAPTSNAPSKSTRSGQAKATRPQRPTAAVLQRMDRLSPPTSAVPQQAPGTGNTGDAAPKRSPSRAVLSDPQPALSFVAHRDSALRQAPTVFPRLLRNQIEEDLEYDKEDLVPPGQSATRGPGMVVYYANGHFCSDLTQEGPTPEEVGEKHFFVLGQSEDRTPHNAASDYSDSLITNIDLDDEVSLLQMDVGSEEASSSGEMESLVDSQASSLRRMSASGMTNSIPADRFTILVKMNHPRKHGRSHSHGPSTHKKRRLALAAPRILSSKAYHHRPLMTKRTAPIHYDVDSSGEEVARPHLTASNLAKHTHPTLANITPPLDDDLPRHAYPDTPSPPHDDYLLSLSAPLHAWAPREMNSLSQSPPVPPRMVAKHRTPLHRRVIAPYPARTTSELSTTTGDERPISLDDMVGPGSARSPTALSRASTSRSQQSAYEDPGLNARMDRLTRRMAEISRATETGDLSRAGQSLGVEVKRIERKRSARHELNAIEGDPVRKRSKRGGTTPSLASRPPLASPIQTPPSSDSQAALYAASWITPPDSRYPPPQAAHLAKVPSHFPLPEPRSSTPSRAKLVERPERLGSLATIAEEVNYNVGNQASSLGGTPARLVRTRHNQQSSESQSEPVLELSPSPLAGSAILDSRERGDASPESVNLARFSFSPVSITTEQLSTDDGFMFPGGERNVSPLPTAFDQSSIFEPNLFARQTYTSTSIGPSSSPSPTDVVSPSPRVEVLNRPPSRMPFNTGEAYNAVPRFEEAARFRSPSDFMMTKTRSSRDTLGSPRHMPVPEPFSRDARSDLTPFDFSEPGPRTGQDSFEPPLWSDTTERGGPVQESWTRAPDRFWTSRSKPTTFVSSDPRRTSAFVKEKDHSRSRNSLPTPKSLGNRPQHGELHLGNRILPRPPSVPDHSPEVRFAFVTPSARSSPFLFHLDSFRSPANRVSKRPTSFESLREFVYLSSSSSLSSSIVETDENVPPVREEHIESTARREVAINEAVSPFPDSPLNSDVGGGLVSPSVHEEEQPFATPARANDFQNAPAPAQRLSKSGRSPPPPSESPLHPLKIRRSDASRRQAKEREEAIEEGRVLWNPIERAGALENFMRAEARSTQTGRRNVGREKEEVAELGDDPIEPV